MLRACVLREGEKNSNIHQTYLKRKMANTRILMCGQTMRVNYCLRLRSLFGSYSKSLFAIWFVLVEQFLQEQQKYYILASPQVTLITNALLQNNTWPVDMINGVHKEKNYITLWMRLWGLRHVCNTLNISPS